MLSVGLFLFRFIFISTHCDQAAWRPPVLDYIVSKLMLFLYWVFICSNLLTCLNVSSIFLNILLLIVVLFTVIKWSHANCQIKIETQHFSCFNVMKLWTRTERGDKVKEEFPGGRSALQDNAALLAVGILTLSLHWYSLLSSYVHLLLCRRILHLSCLPL